MWYVYLAQCSDGSYYCGITTDVCRRMQQHNKGIGAKYTRSRLPIHCVFEEVSKSRSEASIREYEIKQLTHKQKHVLVEKYKNFQSAATVLFARTKGISDGLSKMSK